MVWPFKRSRAGAPARGGARLARGGVNPARDRGRGARVPFFTRVARVCRIFLWCVLAAALAAGSFYVSRHIHRFVYQSSFFEIDALRVSGAGEALEREARQAIERYFVGHGRNLFRLNARTLAAELVNLPRARRVEVRKAYPRALTLSLEERRPLMIVNLDKPYLVDAEGVLLATVQPGEIRALALPILTGIRGALFHLGDQLDQPRLGDVLAAVQFIHDNDTRLRDKIVEWNLNGREEVTAILRSGTEVPFGDRAPLELLDKLSSGLLVARHLEQATVIDLRMDNQIVYR